MINIWIIYVIISMSYHIMDQWRWRMESTTLDSSRIRRDMGKASKYGMKVINMKGSG